MNPIDGKLRSGLRASGPIDRAAPRRRRRRRHRDRGRRGRRRLPHRRRRRRLRRVGRVRDRDRGPRRERARRDRRRSAPPRAPRSASRSAPPIRRCARSASARATRSSCTRARARVGQAAIQFAVLWGATVIATSSERRVRAHPRARRDPGRLRRRVSSTASAPRRRRASPSRSTPPAPTRRCSASLDLVADRERIATIVRGRDAASFGIRAFQGGAPTPLSARSSSDGAAKPSRSRSP